MQFDQLGLHEAVLRAASAEGYSVATPIQAQAIPHVLAGKDVLGCAQTGTGKTAAFAMPILDRLSKGEQSRRPRCLVLSPTRELASQIADSFRTYGRNIPLKYSVIFGGVNQSPQVTSLRHGVDVIIATPGRLLDLYQQRHVDLSGIEIFVLDEADRMLDMGFITDIRKLIAHIPKKRQTLLFSATMPPEIRKLADTILHQPVTVEVAPVSSTADRIEQSVYFCDKNQKTKLLAHLIDELPMFRTIVFTRTKHGADKVVKNLKVFGIDSEAIHGNKTQNARKRALDRFRNNKIPVLVATDIASRGIDIDDISHVVNYDLTHEPETYVHRIGRTGRAGASGQAISLVDREERGNLRAIEKLIRRAIPVEENPLGDTAPMPAEKPQHAPRHEGGHGGHARQPQHRSNHAPSRPAHTQSRGEGASQGGYSKRPQGPKPHGKPQHQKPNGPRPQHAAASDQRPSHPRQGSGRPTGGGHARPGKPARNQHPMRGRR
ncbi:MAG: DEAD/DEAH box helicase [Tepidisphaeraceae bacterium]